MSSIAGSGTCDAADAGEVAVRRGAVPCSDDGEQLHVAAECLHLLMIAILECAVAPQHVGGLAHDQAQVRQVERNVLELEQRSRFRLMAEP